MIVVRLNGGLGNQMFQYAVGRRLAFERKCPLWLDTSIFEDQESLFARRYALNAFGVRAHLLTSRLSFWEKMVLAFSRPQSVQEEADHKLQDFPSRGSLRLSGWWQREEYFAPITDIVRGEFQLSAPLTSDRQQIAAQLDARSVSIHVRRGDYAAVSELKTFFGTCEPAWYAAAITFVEERIPNPRFFVFSDDPEWARANLPLHDRAGQFIELRADKRDFEDLHLMSRCAHHIIANSSFSWWAAWLNSSPEKIVVAPKVWYKGKPDWPVHAPPSWVRL